MRVGHKYVDMGHMVDRQPAAADLLHCARGDFAERCASKQYGVDRHHHRPRSTKQQRLFIPLTGTEDRAKA